MMRSLYSGVAGLKTHQTKMDVIGNNIANVNTTSYKSQSITFSDLMYQTTQTASGATETKGGINARQIGLGTKSGAINTAITSQGTTQTTNNPFDIMITGQAFFVVNNGVENLYTRDGSFYVDGAGNLAMQSNGYLVQGWAAQEDRETGEITVNKNGGLSSLQIMSPANFTYSPASTTAAYFNGNIDDNDTNVKSDDGKVITLEFYDNKGYLYTGKFTLKNTAPKENHTYALTLTDILDSSGKSINDNEKKYDLMSQISFGDIGNELRTSKPQVTQPTYSVSAGTDSSVITINKEGGDVKFDKVPSNGKLTDLMSPEYSKNDKLANLLNDAYGLSDEAIKGEYPGYLTAEYTIGDDGKITINSTVKNVPSLLTAENVIFDATKFTNENIKNPNTERKYFVNAATQKAYKVPTSTGTFTGQASNDISAEMLRDVFGINETFGAGYKFTYDEAGYLSIYKNVEIQSTKGTVDQIYSQLEKFADGDNNSLIQALASYRASNTLNTLKYEYTNGQITIMQPGTEPADGNKSFNMDFTAADTGAFSTLADGVKFPTNLNWGTNDALALSYQEISNIANDGNGTYSDEEKALAQKILGQVSTIFSERTTNLPGITSGDLADLKIRVIDINGTPGIDIIYPSTKSVDKPFPDANATSPTTYENKPVAKAHYNDTDYKTETPKYVYNSSNTYGTSYYLLGDKLETTITKNTVNADFLRTVFPGADADITKLLAEMDLNPNREYKMTVESSGYLSITHKEPGEGKSPVYDYTKADDGSFTYKTNQAYEDVPRMGNISDLLETANGKYKGLLSKVYGITDEMADAYGLDGTYSIDNTPGSSTFGQISLRTGDHSIQLKFNADDGSIQTADNGKDGKVNITFGQGYPGLEAFGFQASPNNAAEQERAYTISVDFSSLTNYNTSGSATIKAVKGDMQSLNTGRAVGEMNGVSVSDNGQIYASYSNGQTKLLGQIASAEFANASGLSKQGDNLYASTLNSGEATVQDITTDGGYMSTGVLEMSNVDLSAQFTEMITTQRGFQANSRIITVSDTLLEELTNLKR